MGSVKRFHDLVQNDETHKICFDGVSGFYTKIMNSTFGHSSGFADFIQNDEFHKTL